MGEDLYRRRPLSLGYPDLERLGVEWFRRHQSTDVRSDETVQCLGRLVDLATGLATVAVVGCGPNPTSVRLLLDRGFDAVGVEPVPGSLEPARQAVSAPARILAGSAESSDLGRQVGFAQFYSRLDLIDLDAPSLRRSALRRGFVRAVRSHHWIRALALVQFGNAIFMLKRPA
jgi:hypothetical protein